MRIGEMREREDFDHVLCETLARGWSQELGSPTTVTHLPRRHGQDWYSHSLLSAYWCADPAPEVRGFLRESFRHTPARHRAAVQWVFGTLLTTGAGLKALGRRGLSVTPRIERADKMLIVPGNQRIRVFDFERGTTRVLLKQGFGPNSFRNEWGVRGTGAPGPFPPITRGDPDSGWFEEEIFDGYALPRCPPRFDKAMLAKRAMEKLEQWSLTGMRERDAGEYAGKLRNELLDALRSVPGDGNWDQVERAAGLLAERAAGFGPVETARGHGDFQPGNILVSRDGRDVTIIDWEHSATRYREYDRFVFGVASRSGTGILRRLGAFVRGRSEGVMRAFPADRTLREAGAALFLLEDLLWFARESIGGPFRVPSDGLVNYRDELGRDRDAFAAVLGLR